MNKTNKYTKALILWQDLSTVSVNSDDEIEIDWHIFYKGTTKEEIWHWFEDYFDLSVMDDLMGAENTY